LEDLRPVHVDREHVVHPPNGCAQYVRHRLDEEKRVEGGVSRGVF
jgi:hypothetical protein